MKDSIIKTPEEIGFLQIANILIKFKFSIVFITLIFAFASVYYALSLPNIYRSTSVLKVYNDSSQPNISSALSQYASIASMAGISIPSAGNHDKTQFIIETIESRDFLQHLLNISGVKESLYASKAYDQKSNEIIFDKKIYDAKKNIWVRKPPPNKSSEPSLYEVYNDVYSEQLNIEINKQSGFISISFDHLSPIFAYEFLNLIIKELNKVSRNNDMSESRSALNYLEGLNKSVTQKDIKSSLNLLIESQLKIQMLTNTRENYLLSPIDKPFIPENKFSPNRASICIFWTIVGFFISSIYALIRTILFDNFNGNDKNKFK